MRLRPDTVHVRLHWVLPRHHLAHDEEAMSGYFEGGRLMAAHVLLFLCSIEIHPTTMAGMWFSIRRGGGNDLFLVIQSLMFATLCRHHLLFLVSTTLLISGMCLIPKLTLDVLPKEKYPLHLSRVGPNGPRYALLLLLVLLLITLVFLLTRARESIKVTS